MYLPTKQAHDLILFMLGSVFSITVVQGQTFDLLYTIDEELPLYSPVGNVGRDSNISQLLSAEDYATLRYRILLYPDSHNNFFTIVNTTGMLKTAASIDRENLCFYETECKLTLHVAAQTESGQQFYTFKITVMVRDINDNSPTFSMSNMNLKINEDSPVSSSFPIISASDRDILNNTIQRYSLVTPSDTFGLKVTRNLDDSLTPALYVKALMDRERQPHYFLKVMALDGGSPRRSGELTINVTLDDVNDNAPRFTKQIYDETVAEISPIGHRVMTLSATDEDIGNNGRVEFRLGARQSEESFKTFRVVPNTGDILTLRDLTPLQGQTMRLVVEAVDQGAKAQTAQAVVNIHILDSVNNAPAIRMTIPPGSPVSRITENASPGFVVAHFMVEDADSGPNGAVVCHLQDDTFGLQRLKEAEYKVTVYKNLDRERIPFYDVTITCMDGGSPSLTTNVAFSVILEDANDNPPRFLSSVYRANVSENSYNNFVLRLEAEDIDLGQNGSVSYRLGNVTSLVSTYISVNPASGEITTKKKLDHEMFTQLDFQVVAADSGSPSLSSSARVIIDVIDQNDNFPQVPSDYKLTVPENRPIGTIVGRVQAIDPDEGPAGEIGYQLLTDNDATKLFNMTQDGLVRTLQKFDRETRDTYNINVLARDFGSNPQTNILHMRIVITDTNDHTPVFEFPNKHNNTVYATLDSRYNTTVTTVVASDRDAGENASLAYSIVDGGKDVFEVDSRTGRIFVMRHLYLKDKGTYDINLFVRDSGVQPLSTTEILHVILTEGNGTAALTGFGNNEHIIIVAILVGATVFIAIVVFLIVIKFLKKDRRNRRPKYTGGLPMEVKTRTQSPEEDASSDEGPWRRYDAAKRPNGPGISGDVVYEPNDDIIMFKLKLADQYKELEPEDKDPACCGGNRDDASNRNSMHSDMDGAPDSNRDRAMARLATFQGKATVVQATGFGANPDQKEKVWRSALKEKMTEEVMSSSSRETTGADSGRGPSEDGSQGRSSVTDDSGCLISPSHSNLRGNTPKYQGNHPRPLSGSGYDRPPFLMTFQPDTPTNGNGYNGVCPDTGTLKEYNAYSYPNSPNPHPSSRPNSRPASPSLSHRAASPTPSHRAASPTPSRAASPTPSHRAASPTPSHRAPSPSFRPASPRQINLAYNGSVGYSIQMPSGEQLHIGDFTLHQDLSPDQDPRNTTLKKVIHGDDGYGSNASSGSYNNGGRVNGMVRPIQLSAYPYGHIQEIRLCSEPPTHTQDDGVLFSPYNASGIQETGLTPSPSHLSPNRQFTTSPNNQQGYTGGGQERARSAAPGSTTKFIYPSAQGYSMQASHGNGFRQTSCPTLYDDAMMEDPHSQDTLPANNRSKSFNNYDVTLTLTVPSRSMHDMLNESLETQDDGNTTTTSGSYTIDHEELTLDLPQTDVFV